MRNFNLQYSVSGPFRILEEELRERAELESSDVTIEQLLLLEWKNVFMVYQERLRVAASDLIQSEREGHQNQHQHLIVALKETFADLSNGT